MDGTTEGTPDGTAIARTETVTTPALKLSAGGVARLASLFSIDNDKVQNGAWMNFGEGIRIRVRRNTSDKAKAAADQFLAPFRPAMGLGMKLSKAQDAEFAIFWVANGLAAEWENMTDGEDVVPCTPDNVSMLVTELPELRDAIIEFSGNMQNYRPDPPKATPAA